MLEAQQTARDKRYKADLDLVEPLSILLCVFMVSCSIFVHNDGLQNMRPPPVEVIRVPPLEPDDG